MISSETSIIDLEEAAMELYLNCWSQYVPIYEQS